jgi:hypothetical protein
VTAAAAAAAPSDEQTLPVLGAIRAHARASIPTKAACAVGAGELLESCTLRGLGARPWAGP